MKVLRDVPDCQPDVGRQHAPDAMNGKVAG